MPPMHRVWALGETLRQAIDRQPERIALIGTGGSSHWPCTPDSGKINEAWDHALLDHLLNKRKHALLDYDEDQAYRDAGQGAGEMRTSVCVAAACTDQVGETWFSAAIPAYATTCTIAPFSSWMATVRADKPPI